MGGLHFCSRNTPLHGPIKDPLTRVRIGIIIKSKTKNKQTDKPTTPPPLQQQQQQNDNNNNNKRGKKRKKTTTTKGGKRERKQQQQKTKTPPTTSKQQQKHSFRYYLQIKSGEKRKAWALSLSVTRASPETSVQKALDTKNRQQANKQETKHVG